MVIFHYSRVLKNVKYNGWWKIHSKFYFSSIFLFFQSAAKSMEIRARFELMQAKGVWEKLETEMKADQELSKKSTEAQMDAINK